MQRSGRDDRPAAGDVGGRPEVEVPERPGAPARGLLPDPAPGVEARLHRDLGQAGQLVEAHQVADDGDLGVTGDGEVRPTRIRPARSRSAPVASASAAATGAPRRRRSTAPCPRRSGSSCRRGPAPRARGVDEVTASPGAARHPGRSAHRPPCATAWARRPPAALAAVEEQDPGVLRADGAELVVQRVGGELADLPGQLDPGRPAADEGEGQPAPPLVASAAVSASSNAPKILRRIASASAIVFMPGAHRANSSCPKYDWRTPAATMRSS